MSVEHYPCDCCEYVFCDCGDYVQCECGKHWCSDECAKEEGFKVEVDNEEEYGTSCGYCRNEVFTDEELLDHALDLLNMTREELTKKKRSNT